MTHYSELYQPCPVEEFLSSELGVWSYNVMLFAVQHPALQKFSLDSHVKPAVLSLKAAGLDHTDIWFVITKRLELLSEPISLQRWLDFMAAQVCAVPLGTASSGCSKCLQCRHACMHSSVLLQRHQALKQRPDTNPLTALPVRPAAHHRPCPAAT